MQEENNEQEDSLSKFYELKTDDEKEAYKQNRQGYFDKVASLLPRVSAAKSRLNEIRAALKAKVKELEEQLKKQAKDNAQKPKAGLLSRLKISEKTDSQASNVVEDDLLKQDLDFCKLALVEGTVLDAKIDSDKNTLENILSAQEKRPYNVITSVALNPLPSDRAKDKNQDKDKNKNPEQQKPPAEKKNANNRLSAADLKKLRNGQSLDSVSEPKSAPKTYIPSQNINMANLVQQQGR